MPFTRREFASVLLAAGAKPLRLFGATSLDDTLATGIKQRKIPAVTAQVATVDKILYTGAFGKRDGSSGIDVKSDSIFRIASMTKAVTTTAAMQLVEQGKLDLNVPASKYLPELGKLDVLEGFDKTTGKPILRPAKRPVELRHLLTHTSGFAYAVWDEPVAHWAKATGNQTPPGAVAPLTPLAFEPGTQWQYGTGIDWAGKIVETVSGLSLEQYFQRNILGPLGMKDTTFILPEEKFNRLVSTYRRQSDGSLKEDPRTMPAPPKEFNGGGGLFSSAPDYIRFTQMILRKGKSADGRQILAAKTVEMMSANQIGSVNVHKMTATDPTVSADVDMHPGAADKYTFGFLMNPVAYEGGRSAGSLAWAGVENTFYWIDAKRGVSAVIMMQFFPFVDAQAVG
ncbi:MAG: beta-lactamase family protein, partial [Acidobacteriia bacterium]|nr:beta-lactamase family protein [Terriglobia bacterium]